jgi:hypothetical protein
MLARGSHAGAHDHPPCWICGDEIIQPVCGRHSPRPEGSERLAEALRETREAMFAYRARLFFFCGNQYPIDLDARYDAVLDAALESPPRGSPPVGATPAGAREPETVAGSAPGVHPESGADTREEPPFPAH